MQKKPRFYIGSKLGTMEAAVRSLASELVARGYENACDWTAMNVARPYDAHPDEADVASERMFRAVLEADIVIILCAPDGLGYHIETGVALGAGAMAHVIGTEHCKHIFVVGEGNERSMFYYHRSVTRVPDTEALLEQLPYVT